MHRQVSEMLQRAYRPHRSLPDLLGAFVREFSQHQALRGGRVHLRGTGTVTQNSNPANSRTVNFATDPAVQQDIANYERELEDEAKDFKYYPVLGFGFGYKF